MNHENIVWSHSTSDFKISCFWRDVSFSDIVNDNESLQRSIQRGFYDVVRLVAEVSLKGALPIGEASKEALMRLEPSEPIDLFVLDHEDVRYVVVGALAQAIDNLALADEPLVEAARKLRDEIHQFIPDQL